MDVSLRHVLIVHLFFSLAACSTGSTTGEGTCDPNPEDPSRFVIVGFWDEDASCSGDPMITNAFPVSEDAGCYCWPGNSGSNSADGFSCTPSENSFTYIQYNSLTCGEGDDSPVSKTVYTEACEQDYPPNLYAKIIDYGACNTTN